MLLLNLGYRNNTELLAFSLGILYHNDQIAHALSNTLHKTLEIFLLSIAYSKLTKCAVID